MVAAEAFVLVQGQGSKKSCMGPLVLALFLGFGASKELSYRRSLVPNPEIRLGQIAAICVA